MECHPAGINTHTTLNMPDCVSEEARSLIQQVIESTPRVSTLGLHISRAHCSKAMRKLFGGWERLTYCYIQTEHGTFVGPEDGLKLLKLILY